MRKIDDGCERLVLEYLHKWPQNLPVSVSIGVRKIREQCPNVVLTDRLIEEVLIDIALFKGYGVCVDTADQDDLAP